MTPRWVRRFAAVVRKALIFRVRRFGAAVQCGGLRWFQESQ
jgi:hypothetical protein